MAPTGDISSRSDASAGPEGKIVTGYCEPWSLRAGESVNLMASTEIPGPATLSLVRISCGDPTKAGPGYAEWVVPSDLPATVSLDHQPLEPGSYGTVDLSGLAMTRSLKLRFAMLATRPADHQVVVSLVGESVNVRVEMDDGQLHLRFRDQDLILRARPLANRRWYDIEVGIDVIAGTLSGSVSTAPTGSPARDLMEPASDPVVVSTPIEAGGLDLLTFGGADNQGLFDGKLAAPSLIVDDIELGWDLSLDMAGRALVDGSGRHRHGQIYQLPARAVTGPSWDGSSQRWTDAPHQWNAIHFHKDDLYDAGWTKTATLEVPPDLPSGIYAFRVETEHGDDRVPFFVRPAEGAPTGDIALLLSSATYLAYANHRMLFEGADFIRTRDRLRPEHDYVRRHPEVGRSLYEKHPDGSGVMFSSRRRPVLNLRPGADGWNFTPDTDINAFLDHLDVGHDVISDEDVHADGFAAFAPYRVVVTSSHPEYWSTEMVDALDLWQRQGGRLLYLGGNGIYWRVAFSDAWPGAMELRRAEDGVRNWETDSGESYHAFTGEYGGMWRRLGRPPNGLVGVGFAAQGFDRATHFDINEESRSSRAAWIWDGVVDDEGRIGTSGLGGGAAGQEVDRYDTRRGSPTHAVVLASATDFGEEMIRTKEEFEGAVVYVRPDPYVRSDIVFFETPGGGAVFSVSSISWFGALARNGYDNDVAQMTTNVVRRFLDPEPFEVPTSP